MENLLRGSLGFKGERGYSAYEIAVKNGFEGTEREWLLSLITDSDLLGEYAIVTATISDIPTTGSGFSERDFPEGFNKNNSVVVSAMSNYDGNWYYSIDSTGTSFDTLKMPIITDIKLGDYITTYMKNTSEDAVLDGVYKIVLKKI